MLDRKWGADMRPLEPSRAVTRQDIVRAHGAGRRKSAPRTLALLMTVAVFAGVMSMSPSVSAFPLQGTAAVDVRDVSAGVVKAFTVTVNNPSGGSTINWVRLSTPGAGGGNILAVSRAGAFGWVGSASNGAAVFTAGSLPGGQSRQFKVLATVPARAADQAVGWVVQVSDDGGFNSTTQLEQTPGSLTTTIRILSADVMRVTSPVGTTDDEATAGQVVTVRAAYTNHGTVTTTLTPRLSSSALSDQIPSPAARQLAPRTSTFVDFAMTMGNAGPRTLTSFVATPPNGIPGGIQGSLPLQVSDKPSFTYVADSLTPRGVSSARAVTFRLGVNKQGAQHVTLDPSSRLELRNAVGAVVLSAPLGTGTDIIDEGPETIALRFGPVAVPSLPDGSSYTTHAVLVGEDENGAPIGQGGAPGGGGPVTYTLNLPTNVSVANAIPHAFASLSSPNAQPDPDGFPAAKTGDVLTIGGPIRVGPTDQSALDTNALVTSCTLVMLNQTGTGVVSTTSVPACGNVGGNLTGTVTVPNPNIVRGFARLDVVLRKPVGGSASPPIQHSNLVAIDNDSPTISKAFVGCAPGVPASCNDYRTIRVQVSEPVLETTLPLDFTVAGSPVLLAESACTATTYCDQVTLTLLTEFGEGATPVVSFAHLGLPTRQRPHDAAGHAVPNGSTAATEEYDDPPAAPTPTSPTDPLASPTTLSVTGPGQVLVVTVNALQLQRATDEPCPEIGVEVEGTTDYENSEGCGATLRKQAFAKRIVSLAQKEVGAEGDGMRFAPDIIVLQEVGCGDAGDLAAQLKSHIQVDVGSGVQPANYEPTHCSTEQNRNTKLDRSKAEKKAGVKRKQIKWDTAFLHLTQTMTTLARGNGRDAGANNEVADYTYQQRPTKCNSENEKKKHDQDCDLIFRRQVIQGFQETVDGGFRLAVASIHYPPFRSLADSEHRGLIEGWATQVADRLGKRYPDTEVDYRLIAGDHNFERCESHPENPKEPVLPPQCGESAWWTALTGVGRRYRDSVYSAHGTTDETMEQQYRDGCLDYEIEDRECLLAYFRPFRIDFVFPQPVGAVQDASRDASHDLTCGEGDPNAAANRRNCRYLPNAERYSDHRLVWAILGQPAQALEPTPPVLPSLSPLPTPLL